MKPVHKTVILRLRREHADWTIRQIAEAAGCHPQTVRYWLSEKDRQSRAAYAKLYLQRPGVAARLVAEHAAWRDANRAAAREMFRDSYVRRRDRVDADPELRAAARQAASERQRLRRERLRGEAGRADVQARVLASIGYRGRE
jgi:transcriptional regulator with XRE-family HTH domain